MSTGSEFSFIFQLLRDHQNPDRPDMRCSISNNSIINILLLDEFSSLFFTYFSQEGTKKKVGSTAANINRKSLFSGWLCTDNCSTTCVAYMMNKIRTSTGGWLLCSLATPTAYSIAMNAPSCDRFF